MRLLQLATAITALTTVTISIQQLPTERRSTLNLGLDSSYDLIDSLELENFTGRNFWALRQVDFTRICWAYMSETECAVEELSAIIILSRNKHRCILVLEAGRANMLLFLDGLPLRYHFPCQDKGTIVQPPPDPREATLLYMRI